VLYGGRIRRFREKFNNSETDDPNGVEEFSTCRKYCHMHKSCVVDCSEKSGSAAALQRSSRLESKDGT
jgi:hypothetical protein